MCLLELVLVCRYRDGCLDVQLGGHKPGQLVFLHPIGLYPPLCAEVSDGKLGAAFQSPGWSACDFLLCKPVLRVTAMFVRLYCLGCTSQSSLVHDGKCRRLVTCELHRGVLAAQSGLNQKFEHSVSGIVGACRISTPSPACTRLKSILIWTFTCMCNKASIVVT